MPRPSPDTVSPRHELPDMWIHRTPKRAWRGTLESANASTSRGRGSGAGTEHWFHVLLVLTRHEYRSRYRAQALGIFWSLLHPLVMMAILSVIFTRVFRSATPNFPIFLLIGLVAWQWVTVTANTATQSFVTNAELIKHTVFPRQLLPISLVLSLTVNFLTEALLLPLFIPFFPNAFRLTPALLLVPLFVVFMLTLLIGVALVVSVLNVIYRDVAYLVSTAFMLLYWLTPVVYPLDIVPEPYQMILKCNPIGGIVTALRNAIMLGETPSLLGWAGMILPTVIILAFGWYIFGRFERVVLDYV
jgi:ABC-type polysaccharide/polyol phosphate export permease